jgi:hypothetical protein
MATQIGKTVQYRIGGPDTAPVYRAARITTVATDTVCNLSIDTEPDDGSYPTITRKEAERGLARKVAVTQGPLVGQWTTIPFP